MSDHGIHTLTGAYAADALPDTERRDFEAHLQLCPTCRQEVAELTATAARLGSAVASPAPAGLRATVLAEVATVRQLSPADAAPATVHARRSWIREPLAIAASLLVVVALGLGAFAVAETRRADRAEQTAARIAAVATDPGRGQVTRPGTSGGSGIVIMARGQAIFRAVGLPELPDDRTYQLWVLDDRGGARSVGVLGRGAGGSLQQFVDHVLPTDRLGLSVEARGGAKKPTTDPVVVVPMPA